MFRKIFPLGLGCHLQLNPDSHVCHDRPCDAQFTIMNAENDGITSFISSIYLYVQLFYSLCPQDTN